MDKLVRVLKLYKHSYIIDTYTKDDLVFRTKGHLFKYIIKMIGDDMYKCKIIKSGFIFDTSKEKEGSCDEIYKFLYNNTGLKYLINKIH